jgi:phosphatidylglycerophosphatase A
MRSAVLFLATGGFVGYFPVASGTVGSLVAIPFFLLSADAQQISVLATVVVLAALIYGACVIAGQAEQFLQEHDSHAIVIDEIVGYLAATAFLSPTWQHALVAFLIFRVFDVIKPYPASWIDERMQGGYGVVLDDVVSGIYANIATRVVFAIL